jgi:hypothetical protein
MAEPQLDINAINALMVGIPTIQQGPPRMPAIEIKKRGPGRPSRGDRRSMEAKFEATRGYKKQLKAGETQIDLVDEAVRREIARRKAENESS